jgi:hypothetical protein
MFIVVAVQKLSRDGDFDFNTRLQAYAGLMVQQSIQQPRGFQNELTICLTISLDECKSIKRL